MAEQNREATWSHAYDAAQAKEQFSQRQAQIAASPYALAKRLPLKLPKNDPIVQEARRKIVNGES